MDERFIDQPYIAFDDLLFLLLVFLFSISLSSRLQDLNATPFCVLAPPILILSFLALAFLIQKFGFTPSIGDIFHIFYNPIVDDKILLVKNLIIVFFLGYGHLIIVVFTILLFWAVKKGDPEDNKYGLNPLKEALMNGYSNSMTKRELLNLAKEKEVAVYKSWNKEKISEALVLSEKREKIPERNINIKEPTNTSVKSDNQMDHELASVVSKTAEIMTVTSTEIELAKIDDLFERSVINKTERDKLRKKVLGLD